MNKKRTVVACLILLTLVLAAFVFFFTNRGSQSGPRSEADGNAGSLALHHTTMVKWGGPKNISMLPLLAEHEAFFQKKGVSATYVEIQTGKKAMDALRTGDIDLGILVDANIAFAGFEGADDLRVLACIETKRDDALVLTKEGIEKPADLAGQTIGVTLGTTSHAYLVQFLEANGLKPSSVNLQNMPPPAIQAALLNGSLKAGCVWQPFRNNLLTAKPDSFKEWKDTKVYTSYVLVVCSKRFLETSAAGAGKGSPVAPFLEALIAAESYAAQNQAAAQAILAEELGIPAAVMNRIWPEYQLNVFLSRELLTLLEKEGKWISESVVEHKGKPLPNYRPFIHEEVLRSVAPERVRNY